MIDFINGLIPVRGIFNLNFLHLNIFLILSIILGFVIGKKYLIKVNVFIIFVVLLIYVGIIFGLKEFSYYYLILYSFSILGVGYTAGFYFNKRYGVGTQYESYPEERTNIKTVSLLIIYLFLFSLIYIFISGGSFSNVIEADTWIHLSKILKYDNFGILSSPVFSGENHHYPPYSYFIARYIYDFLALKNLSLFYGFFSLCFLLLNTVIYFILVKRFTGKNYVSLLSLFYFSYFSFVFIPNFYLIFIELLLIYIIYLGFTTYKGLKTKIYVLILLLINIIGITHYFGIAELVGFSTIYIILSITFKIFPKLRLNISNFFISSYDKSYYFLTLNQYVLTQFFLAMIVCTRFIGYNQVYTSYSEIGLKFEKPIGFLMFFIIVPIIGYIFKKYSKNNKLLIFMLSLFLLWSNSIFYYFNLFSLHGRYFAEKSVLLIVIPFGLLIFYNNNSNIIKSLFYKIVLILLYCYTMFGTQYNYLSNYVISSGFYREYLMSELAQFKSLLEKETIYYDPYSFLNRYSVVDLNSYIYAVNYKDNGVPRPFTTIPEKIKYFNFSDPQGRLDLSISFMTDPNNITYELLKNYKIDYFILDKQKDKKIINFLKGNTRKVFETRSYVCFEYK